MRVDQQDRGPRLCSGSAFFRHLIAFLHPLSLAILLEIAQHPELSSSARRVSISGERIGSIVSDLNIDNKDLSQQKDLQLIVRKSGLDAIILKKRLELYRIWRVLKLTRSLTCLGDALNLRASEFSAGAVTYVEMTASKKTSIMGAKVRRSVMCISW